MPRCLDRCPYALLPSTVAPCGLRPNTLLARWSQLSLKKANNGSFSLPVRLTRYATSFSSSAESCNVLGRSCFLNADFINSGGVRRTPFRLKSLSPTPRSIAADRTPIASSTLDLPAPFPPMNMLTRPNSSVALRMDLKRSTLSFLSIVKHHDGRKAGVGNIESARQPGPDLGIDHGLYCASVPRRHLDRHTNGRERSDERWEIRSREFTMGRS